MSGLTRRIQRAEVAALLKTRKDERLGRRLKAARERCARDGHPVKPSIPLTPDEQEQLKGLGLADMLRFFHERHKRLSENGGDLT